MKRWMAIAVAAVLVSITQSALAATKSIEERCRAQAERHKIGSEQLDTYVKTCVEKHRRKTRAHAPPAVPARPAPPPAGPGH